MSSRSKRPKWMRTPGDLRLAMAGRLEREAKLIRATAEGQSWPPPCRPPWPGLACPQAATGRGGRS